MGPLSPEDRYDSLIRYYALLYGLPWRMIKAQIRLESRFEPRAKSKSGAQGLAQFMPHTWSWVWRKLGRADPETKDPYNPEDAIAACCLLMAHLEASFPEIPDPGERYRFALAAYNTGRQNINRALAYAREACGLPASHAQWSLAGRPAGPWQRWAFASRFLSRVTGSFARETVIYVDRIAP